MDRFIAAFTFAAFIVTSGSAGPIHSEYGVPFETYGPPSAPEVHSPQLRSLDLPPIELPPPVDRIFLSDEVPPQKLSDEVVLAPVELPPPIRRIITSKVPNLPVELQGVEFFELELPPPVAALSRSPVVSSPESLTRGGEIIAPPNTKIHITDGKNQYSVGFQNPDGTEVNEQGRLISTDNGWEYVIAKTGSYRYISPEGTPVHVEWVADEKGFRVINSEA